MASTHTVYNKHSWFSTPEKHDDYYVTRSYDSVPADDTHTSLVIITDNNKVIGLKFRGWKPNRCTNHTTMVDELVVEIHDGKIVPNAEFLELLFGFTGIGPSSLVSDDLSVAEFYKLIYSIEFTTPIHGIYIETCGCNMGHCSAVVGFESEGVYNTVGELFSWLGTSSKAEGACECPSCTNNTEDRNLDYYEYPDSVMLSLEQIKDLPTHGGHTGKTLLKPIGRDSDLCYFSMSYGR